MSKGNSWVINKEVEKSFCSRTGKPKTNERIWIENSKSEKLFLACNPMPKFEIGGAYEADINLAAAAPDLLVALIAQLEQSPFVNDEETCECGIFEETGICPDVLAHRAIAKASVKEAVKA